MTRPLREIEADLTTAGAAIRRLAPDIDDTGLADALAANFPHLVAEFAAALAAGAGADRAGSREAAP